MRFFLATIEIRLITQSMENFHSQFFRAMKIVGEMIFHFATYAFVRSKEVSFVRLLFSLVFDKTTILVFFLVMFRSSLPSDEDNSCRKSDNTWRLFDITCNSN